MGGEEAEEYLLRVGNILKGGDMFLFVCFRQRKISFLVYRFFV